MSLRYRLFLLVSGLFIAVSCWSYFIENYVLNKGFQKAQIELRAKILGLSEKRRTDLQDFLASILAENEERLNAILFNLSSFTPQLRRFGPTVSNSQNGTWGEAADLVIEYKWIDFLQNTNQGKVTSEIIPKQTNLAPLYRIRIDGDLSWIYVDDHKANPVPYLGIQVPYTMVSRIQEDPMEISGISGLIPEIYLLFDAQNMLSEPKGTIPPIYQSKDQNWEPIPVKWTEGYVLEVAPVIAAFQKARELLLSKQIQMPELSESELSSKTEGISLEHRNMLTPLPPESVLSTSTKKAMMEHLEELVLNYTQSSMIWGLVAFHETGIFGKDLFAFPSPNALALFGSKNDVGMGVDASSVLSSERLFNDAEYFEAHPPGQPPSNLASSLAVITLPHSEHVYLGNTAQFTVKTASEKRLGYLTLGVDIDIVLKRLVGAIHQSAILVHGGKPLSAYSEQGKELTLGPQVDLPFSQMLSETSGMVSWNKKNYFFIHLQPFPSVDLHFFLLNPEDVQFALIRELQRGSTQIVDSILFNIHIAGLVALVVALLLLHNISRKITKPIAQLAKATGEVAEGRLDEVQLSLPPLKHNDEIAVLCHSFEEMVKGLKEKEKVKGVLNKVVSNEIAQEILKGNVHLGGEEKKATVLFADIRDFTKMTQNMLPQQVIELLNGCMTKVSHVIDKNGGVIDKFVGDEVMALFGAPISHEDVALKAIISALEMIEDLKTWNVERRSQGLPEIEIGIGIHTGPVLAGNMGAENRLNYTVLGSNVNLASRLCDAAKRMEILVTKDTLDEPYVKDRVVYEALPAMAFKGFDKSVEIFRIQGLR